MSQSLLRAIEILKIVGEDAKTPSDIARELDVHRSTALRLMETLLSTHFLRKLPDGRYCLGSELLVLAHQAREQLNLAKIAHARLAKLSREHDKTVHLAELQGNQIIYTDKIEPQRTIRLTSRVGQAVCLHTASVAKTILAFQPEEIQNQMLSGHVFEIFTPTTLPSRQALEEELDAVRKHGWATDNGEREDYINSIGVPIHNAAGSVIAAISVIELKVICDLELMKKSLLDHLQAAALEISRENGWRG